MGIPGAPRLPWRVLQNLRTCCAEILRLARRHSATDVRGLCSTTGGDANTGNGADLADGSADLLKRPVDVVPKATSHSRIRMWE